MAKALLGHVGVGPDLRLVSELRRLRARVRELEDEIGRVRALNDALTATARVNDEFLTLSEMPEPEPALT